MLNSYYEYSSHPTLGESVLRVTHAPGTSKGESAGRPIWIVAAQRRHRLAVDRMARAQRRCAGVRTGSWSERYEVVSSREVGGAVSTRMGDDDNRSGRPCSKREVVVVRI